MIATISPGALALRHTRNTLHYAGTASTICLAAPKAAAPDLELQNVELQKKNKKVNALNARNARNALAASEGAEAAYIHACIHVHACIHALQLLKELEQRGRDYGELEAQLHAILSEQAAGTKDGSALSVAGGDSEDDVEDERYAELAAMHTQLTSLLASSEASGGLSAAQAAAELAGVRLGAVHGVDLHAQQASLAEARCRERFERRALEEFIRQSLHDDLPKPPPTSHPSSSGEGSSGEHRADGERDGDVDGDEGGLWSCEDLVSRDGGLAELQVSLRAEG